MSEPINENDGNVFDPVAADNGGTAESSTAKASSMKPSASDADDNNEKEQTAVSNNSNQTICRFLVKNIQASKLSTVNLTVDLLLERDSLLAFAENVFDAGLKKHGKVECCGLVSQLWNLTFDGVTYLGGRREGILSCWNFPNMPHIDNHEPRFLKDLPLEVGKYGCFTVHSMGTFDFEVQSLTNVTSKNEPDTSYPIKSKEVKLKLSTKLECDFLTASEQQAALTLRRQYDAHYTGKNGWKRDRQTGRILPSVPLRKPWRGREKDLIVLLQHAGAKFKKSWNAILQYGVIDRPEAASSGQWYKIQREGHLYHVGGLTKGMSKDQALVAAKNLCQTMLERFVRAGAPQPDPQPFSVYENRLLKQCSDYDSEADTPKTKRAKVEAMKKRHEKRELGDHGVPRASLSSIPSIITTAAGVDSHGTGSSESVTEDASVASVAPPDPCAASSRKRGGYPGRNKAKNTAKKEKMQEKKEALIGKKEAVMDTWISQVKEQTATGAELKDVMKKSHQLAEKKEKKSDIKFMLKLAQKKGDNALFDKYMRKMTQMCSLSESESEEEND